MEYRHYTNQRDHILDVPDMYVGLCEVSEVKTRLYRDGRIVEDKIYIPPAVERLFLEVLSNAADNVIRSRREGVDPGNIIVEMDYDIIRITNQGLPIPIQLHSDTSIYIPELIFGTLLSSSNYKTDRYGIGVNGLGAKLCNIFSVWFQVEICDGKQKYIQLWEDHMGIRHDPNITSSNSSPYVTVTYCLDQQYFNYTYDDTTIQLFSRHCIDLSFNLHVPVIFNNVTFNINTTIYTSLYFNNTSSIVVVDNDNVCIFIYTPNKAKSISFVNGIPTYDGGVHVNMIYKQLKQIYNIDTADIKRNISIILSCWVKNPKFNSQSKTKLTSPTPKLRIDDNSKRQLLKWNISNIQLAKTDGKKCRFVGIKSLDDANLAGSRYSDRCILVYTEGDSATGYAVKAVSHQPNGRDYWGIFTGRGKPLNVTNASPEQLMNNRVFNELKLALGLQEGVDYSKSIDKLRYGQLLIMADSDVDGKHIVGLLLNYFHNRYPSLLRIGYVRYLRTPIIKVSGHCKSIRFYTQASYDNWCKEVGDINGYKVKYYKGLGTSNDKDIEEEFKKKPKVVICLYDDDAPQYFNLAFNESMSDIRKQWIEQYKPMNVEDIINQPISQFLYYELTEYMLSNLIRCIPKLTDGLKESQRKALWCSMIKWKGRYGWADAVSRGQIDEIKVNSLAAMTTTECNYKHGEKSMAETIIQMTQGFIGSNNLPYFVPEGQFGTRNKGGDDAADPRYTFVKPQPYLPYIFRNDDYELLDRIIDEGIYIEPITFLPIIPMCLVNGCIGIGSGYSTFIPNHNPIDIINWLRCKLNNKPLPNIKPWYKGFKGTIDIEEKIYNMEDDELGSDQVGNGKKSMVTRGVYEVKDDKIIVTELPIRRYIYPYKLWLDKMVTLKKIRYNNYSTADTVRFEIKGMDNISYTSLRLIRSFGLSNMVLLDDDNKPKRYNSVVDILEEFYRRRLIYYGKRKELMLDRLKKKIKDIEDIVKLFELIVDGKLVIINEPYEVVKSRLIECSIDYKILDKIKLSNCSREEINRRLEELNTLKLEMDRLYNITPETLWLRDLDELEAVISK